MDGLYELAGIPNPDRALQPKLISAWVMQL
jgi:hypothetical protein